MNNATLDPHSIKLVHADKEFLNTSDTEQEFLFQLGVDDSGINKLMGKILTGVTIRATTKEVGEVIIGHCKLVPENRLSLNIGDFGIFESITCRDTCPHLSDCYIRDLVKATQEKNRSHSEQLKDVIEKMEKISKNGKERLAVTIDEIVMAAEKALFFKL